MPFLSILRLKQAMHLKHAKQLRISGATSLIQQIPELSGDVLPGDSDAGVVGQELIDSSSVLIFGHRPGSGRGSRGKSSVPEQASLFG